MQVLKLEEFNLFSELGILYSSIVDLQIIY